LASALQLNITVIKK